MNTLWKFDQEELTQLVSDILARQKISNEREYAAALLFIDATNEQLEELSFDELDCAVLMCDLLIGYPPFIRCRTFRESPSVLVIELQTEDLPCQV